MAIFYSLEIQKYFEFKLEELQFILTNAGPLMYKKIPLNARKLTRKMCAFYLFVRILVSWALKKIEEKTANIHVGLVWL